MAVNKGSGGGAPMQRSAFEQQLMLVDREERERVASLLMAMSLKDFDDISQAALLVSAEVVRGTINNELAATIKGLLELAFTAVAAKNKTQTSSAGAEALRDLANIARQKADERAERRAITATYQIPRGAPGEVVTIESVAAGSRKTG